MLEASKGGRRSKETKESRSQGREEEQKVCSLWVWLLSARMTTGEEEEIDRNTTTNSSWMLNKRMKRREGGRRGEDKQQVIWSNPSQFAEHTNELTCSFLLFYFPHFISAIDHLYIIHQQEPLSFAQFARLILISTPLSPRPWWILQIYDRAGVLVNYTRGPTIRNLIKPSNLNLSEWPTQIALS